MSQNRRQSKELKTLQKEWYLKLKEHGFEDIEDTSSPKEFLKVWHSSYFKVEKRRNDYLTKEEYYYRAKQLYSQYQDCPLFFSSTLASCAWALHTDGYSLRNISSALKAQGYKTNKDDVNKVINGLKTLMRLK